MASLHLHVKWAGSLSLACPPHIYELSFLLTFFSRWNVVDLMVMILSLVGISLDALSSRDFDLNPNIVRTLRVLRVTRGLFTYSFRLCNTSLRPTDESSLVVIRSGEAY